MRVLLDTSVLVAALVNSHPRHAEALAWLAALRHGTRSGLVSCHSLAELYSTLTSLPILPRISPKDAQRMIERGVLDLCEVIPLDTADYIALIDELCAKGLVGGVTYDAIVLRAARKGGADRILTLNVNHFKRICPELADRIATP